MNNETKDIIKKIDFYRILWPDFFNITLCLAIMKIYGKHKYENTVITKYLNMVDKEMYKLLIDVNTSRGKELYYYIKSFIKVENINL